MDYSIEHEDHISTVTITNFDDTKLTAYEIDKIFLPIRKAYLNDKKYHAAPTVITNTHLSNKIVIDFFGGNIVSNTIIRKFVEDFTKHLERYLHQSLSIEEFSQHLTQQFKVEHVDISHIWPKYLSNLTHRQNSAAAI